MMRLTLRLMFLIPVMAVLAGTAYGKSNSSVTVASSVNPATFGASVKFTATVIPSTATGTVTFKDGTTTLGTGAISAGKATFTTTTLSVASHSITASYGGDTNLNSSVSAAQVQVINRASSSVTVASSLNPSTYGSSVKFTATVTPSTATGTVTFKDGTATLGTGAISAGKATFITTTHSVASHSITASYGGNTNYSSSTSAVLTQTVNKANSSVTEFSSANPSALGSSVTFTAAVLPAGVTGTVTFKDGTTTLGTGSISSGTAIFSISTLALGSHSITASYGGDGSYNSSVSTVLTQTVKQLSSVALASSANPSTYTLPVTLTATITPSTATGTVTFKDGTTTLGTGSLSGGHANLTTSALASRPRSLTAVYGGNSTYVSSTSPVLTQNVLTISSIAVSPQNISLPLNSKQQYTATATLSDGSKQNVTSNAIWSSSVTSVATIDATGLLSAPGQGQTSIQVVVSSATGVTSLSVTGPTFWPHTATLLPNGKVLIVGGQDVNLKLIASAELYDPSTGTFSLTGSTVARAYHTATLLPSGKVLIAGGTVGDGSSTSNEADLYDPATGTFTLATFMKNYQSFHSATLLNNGLVLIAGGHYLIAGGGGGFSDNELYDPTANTFTTTGNFITSRQSATASLLSSGKVLVVGGIGSSGPYLASVELFDPATGTFSAAGSPSTSKFSHTATALISGKTLVAGGTGGIGGNVATLNLGEIYDPVPNTFPTAGSLTTKRFAHAVGTFE